MPRWIEEQLRGYGDDTASIRAFGIDVTTRLCEHLLSTALRGCTFLFDESVDVFGGNLETAGGCLPDHSIRATRAAEPVLSLSKGRTER